MKAVEGGGAGEPAGKVRRRLLPDTEVIGPPDCPILHRWTLVGFRGRKLLLHHFQPNADDRAEHDHPSPFWTLVLRGGYDDRVPCTWTEFHTPEARDREIWCPLCRGSGLIPGDRMRPGMLRRRAAEYRHVTRVGQRGCWTLVLMGRKTRRWGFWERGVWWFWRDHEREFGFGMRCEED
jgi:hypothetical protein